MYGVLWVRLRLRSLVGVGLFLRSRSRFRFSIESTFYGIGEIFKIKGVLFPKIKISPTSFYQDFERWFFEIRGLFNVHFILSVTLFDDRRHLLLWVLFFVGRFLSITLTHFLKIFSINPSLLPKIKTTHSLFYLFATTLSKNLKI